MTISLKKYRITLPDLDYYSRLFSCREACPVHTEAGRYIKAISEADYEKAYRIAREPNPLVYTCAQVCGHPCETACRRGRIDHPLSIRALKRVATEHHHSRKKGREKSVKIPPRTQKQKIAVVGAGPAGLSCAYHLSSSGYPVTLFEATSLPGGMLNLGLPAYRLPREIIKLDLNRIINSGIELRLNKRLGTDFLLSDLKKEGYQAIFLALGAHKGKTLRIEGAELDGVMNGVDFLLNLNLGYQVDLRGRVLIIGGGNVAIDVARSALRQLKRIEKMNSSEIKDALYRAQAVIAKTEEKDGGNPDEMRMAFDAARSALRKGAKEVLMVCLESQEEMPAHKSEIAEAAKEKIKILTSRGPRRILGKNGQVTGLEVIRVKSVFDEKGRFNPVFLPGSESVIKAETIIMAIGQASDLSFIREEDGLEITPRGMIAVEEETLRTSAEGVFAGGDLAFGPRLIIDAVADGEKAARAIKQYVQKETLTRKRRTNPGEMVLLSPFQMYPGYEAIEHQEPPVLPLDRRTGITQVELSYHDNQAKKEAERCLHCYIHTLFDSAKCILCGGCIDVCPEYCLKLVNPEDLEGEKELEKFTDHTAIIKDEEGCIRCGLCAKRCPAGAITLEELVEV